MSVSPFNALTNQFTGSIDPVNDAVAFWQSSTSEAFWINQNSLLNLTSQPVGITDSQTLTNKTLTAPTISSPVLSGTTTGTYTIGGTPTFPAAVVTLTGTQTLTNKTITSPAITGGTLANSTITSDSISGYTTPNTGTIFGMSVTSGTIGSAAYGAASILTAAIANAAVTATQLGLTVSTLANSGTAGGTMYYINLGGIKLLWFLTMALDQTSTTPYTVTFPPSFFTTTQAYIVSPTSVATDSRLYANGNGLTIAGAEFYLINSAAAASSATVGGLVIGT